MKTTITIGSADYCDIQYSGRYIEPRHALLELRGENWVIVDVSKKFGVTINGDRITEPTVLQDNSHVKVGTQVLHWRDEINDVHHSKPEEYDHFEWQDFFRWKGTLNSKTFRFFLIPTAVAPLFVFIISTYLKAKLLENAPQDIVANVGPYLDPLFWTMGFGFLLYILLAQCVKRARDSGQPFWKFFIPVYNIYLLLFG